MDVIENGIHLIKAILGLLMIFFIPGFTLTWALYAKRDELSDIRRIAISFIISISIVMLASLSLDLILGIKTTAENILIALAIISGIAGITAVIRWKYSKMHPKKGVLKQG